MENKKPSSLKALPALVLAAFLAGAAACAPLPPPDPPNLAAAKDSLTRGHDWYKRGCPQEAQRYYQEALEKARLSDQSVLIVRAQNSLGAAAISTGDLGRAAGWLDQALDSSLSQPQRPDLDRVLGNLGALAYKAGRRDDAEGFWLRAIEAAEELKTGPAAYYCDLARLYLNHGPAEKFDAAADQALKLAPALDLKKAAEAPSAEAVSVRADALNLAGRQALRRDQADLAEDFFNQALELDRLAENAVGLAQDNEALGRLQIARGQYQGAAGHLDRAFFLWLALDDRESRDRVLALLKDLHRNQGLPKSLSVYEEAGRNPEKFLQNSRCPL